MKKKINEELNRFWINWKRNATHKHLSCWIFCKQTASDFVDEERNKKKKSFFFIFMWHFKPCTLRRCIGCRLVWTWKIVCTIHIYNSSSSSNKIWWNKNSCKAVEKCSYTFVMLFHLSGFSACVCIFHFVCFSIVLVCVA